MRPLLLALAVAAAAVGPAAEAADNAAIARVVRQAGLMGRWSGDCRRAVSPGNPWITVAVGKDGRVTTAENNGQYNSVYRLSAARILRNGDLATRSTWDGDGIEHEIVYRFRGGRQQVWSSVKVNGRKLVVDGVITGNGMPSRWWTRCGK